MEEEDSKGGQKTQKVDRKGGQKLQEGGTIRREGPDRGGKWVIN